MAHDSGAVMKPDLASLYSQLDLRPNCSLEEFQRAYRQRIAELHPDRAGTDPRSVETQALLRDLISMYSTVSRFHRRYGRMPGGPSRRFGANTSPRPATPWRTNAPGTPWVEGNDKRPATSTLTLVILFIALLMLLASWSWLTSGSRDDSGHVSAPRASLVAMVGADRRCPIFSARRA